MKKYAKAFVSLLFVVGVMSASCSLASCNSTKTMNKSKKYSSSKVVKQNIRMKGNNKSNGSTYRSY